jgi:hypothetical protein
MRPAAICLALSLPFLPSCGATPAPQPDLQGLTRSWIDAQQRRDSLGLDSLLAPEFTLTEGANAAPMPRDQYLAALLRPGLLDTLGIQQSSVVFLGDSAVVTSAMRCTVVHPGEASVTLHFTTTDFWARRNRRWQAVARVMVPRAD